jgi:hypothetical protein
MCAVQNKELRKYLQLNFNEPASFILPLIEVRDILIEIPVSAPAVNLTTGKISKKY